MKSVIPFILSFFRSIYDFLYRFFIPRTLINTIKSFDSDGCVMLASSISFNFLLSFIPFLILLGSLMGIIIDYIGTFHHISIDQIASTTFESLKTIFPALNESTLKEFFNIHHYKTSLGAIGLSTLFLSSSLLFNTLKNAFYIIYKGKKTHMIFARLFGMLFIVGLVVITFFLHYLLSLLMPFLQDLSDKIPAVTTTIHSIRSHTVVFNTIGSTLFIILLFFLLFGIFARKASIHGKSIFIGSLLFALLWNIAKNVFTVYLTKISSISIIYGSIAWLIVIIIWVYYSAVLLLFCLEFIKSLNESFQQKAILKLFFTDEEKK